MNSNKCYIFILLVVQLLDMQKGMDSWIHVPIPGLTFSSLTSLHFIVPSSETHHAAAIKNTTGDKTHKLIYYVKCSKRQKQTHLEAGDVWETIVQAKEKCS